MLSTFVKISNVTNLSDARYCAGMGVDMLGFSMDESSPLYISPKKYEEMRAWIAGVQLVIETRQTDPQLLIEQLSLYPCEAVQVENPDLLPFLSTALKKPLLLRVDVDHYAAGELEALMGSYASDVAYFLLETEKNEPLTEHWKLMIGALVRDYPILLGFGLDDAEKVSEALDQTNVAGIALRGSAELRPGYKDFGALMDILEALETDD